MKRLPFFFGLTVLLATQSCSDSTLLGPADLGPSSDILGLNQRGHDGSQAAPTTDRASSSNSETAGSETDEDNDGFPKSQDCDDSNNQVHPAAAEQCNEIDDDCDETIDEEAGLYWYLDLDEDGFGEESTTAQLCTPSEGMVSEGGDCNDANAEIHPSSIQKVDGIDSNCNGKKDWKVTIYVATDDAGELCLNTADTIIGDTGGWVDGTSYEVWMESGTHAVGIKGWDLGKAITATILHLESSEGILLVSDQSWKYDPNPSAGEDSRSGWCSPNFDDSTWDNALDIGPIGDPSNPWGNAPSSFPEGSPARWIWDHFPVDLNTQYLRKLFTLP